MEEDDGFDDFEGLDDLAALDDDSLLNDVIHAPAPATSIPPPVAKPNKVFASLSTTSTSRTGASIPTRPNSFGASAASTGQKTSGSATHPPKPVKDYFSQFRNGGKGPANPTSSNALPGMSCSPSSATKNPAGSVSTPRTLTSSVNQAPQPPVAASMQQDDFEELGDLDDGWLDEGTQDGTAPMGPHTRTPNQAQAQAQGPAQAQAKLFPIFGRQQTGPTPASNNTTSLSFRPSTNQLPRAGSSTSIVGSASSSSWVPASDNSNDFTSAYFRSPERAPASSAPARPTHHTIDRAAVLTWKYPNNYPKRDYQFNITRRALFTNTLVSLPTGLGKTFIAAVVMLNYYRWFPESKVIFMAPTRPLVSQQIEACFKICGIPQRDTIELTGQQNSDFRKQAWITKRVIFCTPQVLQNDLHSNTCPARTIVCLVVDEAHRATGNYAFSEVVRYLTPVNPDVRILALTATPGSDIKTVQQVINNLNIASIELRTEDSMDLRPYVFQRVVQEIVVPPGRTLSEIRDEFKGMTKQYLEKLSKFGVIETAELSSLTRFQVIRGRDFYLRNTGHGQDTMGQVRRLSTLCSGIIHAYELLTIHGIRPFFVNLADPAELARVGYLSHGSGGSAALDAAGDDDLDLDDDDDGGHPVRGRGRGRGGGGRGRGGRGRGRGRGGASSGHDVETSSLAKKTLQTLPAFGRLMNRLVTLQNQANFIGHPKLERLVGIVVEHFVQHQDRSDGIESRSSSTNADGGSVPAEPDVNGSEDQLQTRIMIFANYRESVEEITRVLDAHRPMIRVSSFVGQASAKGKKGITQKEQQKLVSDFQKGHHNVLVATSIGEEGLDIGDVDLIICYDSHSSPIRMLQRMGRTGRKRKGKICLLLSEGQEEQKYRRSVTQYKNVQKSISSGSYLEYYRQSPRILPPGPYPQVDMVRIEAEPYEDPSATKGPRKRRKLNDGTLTSSSTGAVNTSAFLDDEEMARFQCRYLIPKRSVRRITFETASQALVKRLGKVFDQQSMNRSVFDRSFDKKKAMAPGLDPTSIVGHSSTTQAFVRSLWQLSVSRSELLMQAVGYPSRDEYGTRMMGHLPMEGEEETSTMRNRQPAARRVRAKKHSDGRGPRQLALDLFCPVIGSTSESDQALSANDREQKGKGKSSDMRTSGTSSLATRPRTTRPPAHIVICSDDDEDDFEIMQGLDDVLGLTSSRRRPNVQVGTREGASAVENYRVDDGSGDNDHAHRSRRRRTLNSSQSRKRRLLDSSDDDDGEMFSGIVPEQGGGPDESDHSMHLGRGGAPPPLVFDFNSSQSHRQFPRGTSSRRSASSGTTFASVDEPRSPLPERWSKEGCEVGVIVNVTHGFGASNEPLALPIMESLAISPNVMILPPVPTTNTWYRPTNDDENVAKASKNSDVEELSQPPPPRQSKSRVLRLDEEESSSEEEAVSFEERRKDGGGGIESYMPYARRHELLKKDSSGTRHNHSGGRGPGGVVLSSSGGNDFVEIDDDDLAALMDDFSDPLDY
ncbi:hypothetical protein DFQ27_002939 [Actinomortierella ambigua]|uniref:ATP-dependent DNA helicase n=1 Tax=Actinomortierella ambigua TaxID=1343610 RepID=A0A9P6U6C4_9FUNG|nr:hypothetical protein DFQ27_002939 [Actinomortierella ambigua]